MNLMQLFNPQAGADSPQPGGGVMPAGGEDERRAFARALLMASSRLATQPGNFAQGLSSAIGEGGLGYYNELDRQEQERLEEERWRGNQAEAAGRERRRANDSLRDFNYRAAQDVLQTQRQTERDKVGDEQWKANQERLAAAGSASGGGGKGPLAEEVRMAADDATKAREEYMLNTPGATVEQAQAVYDKVYEERLYTIYNSRISQFGGQGIGADSDPRAALPSGTTSSGIQWSVEQ
jgi:hypothetical protein